MPSGCALILTRFISTTTLIAPVMMSPFRPSRHFAAAQQDGCFRRKADIDLDGVRPTRFERVIFVCLRRYSSTSVFSG
jgi:hypothetical protein